MADESQLITLSINIRVLNEDLLRDVASERMAQSGFESDPSLHRTKPLHELAFEALIGSNPDPVGPDQMGIELVDWTGNE